MRIRSCLVGGFSAAALVFQDTHAQTVPTASSAVAGAARDAQVVSLSPFTASSAGDEGYRAANTLAGSRLNSSLNGTPGVLDVLTKGFLDDIGALNLQQALAFSANFEVDNGDFESQGVINTIFAGLAATPSYCRHRSLFRTRDRERETARLLAGRAVLDRSHQHRQRRDASPLRLAARRG
jgi:hypothetical protein